MVIGKIELLKEELIPFDNNEEPKDYVNLGPGVKISENTNFVDQDKALGIMKLKNTRVSPVLGDLTGTMAYDTKTRELKSFEMDNLSDAFDSSGYSEKNKNILKMEQIRNEQGELLKEIYESIHAGKGLALKVEIDAKTGKISVSNNKI
jgi:hypothetical protein